MGFEIRIELDEALRSDIAGYPDLSAYIRDLIETDIDRRRWEAQAIKTELQRAFDTPRDQYELVSAEEVIAQGRARRGA